MTLKTLKEKNQKVAYLWQLGGFFSAAPTAQNSPVVHFRFINSFIQPSLVGSLTPSIRLFSSFLIFQSLGYDQFSFLYVWARLTKVDPFGRVISCGAFFAFPFMIDLVVLKWADKQRFLPHEVCGLAHICPAL